MNVAVWFGHNEGLTQGKREERCIDSEGCLLLCSAGESMWPHKQRQSAIIYDKDSPPFQRPLCPLLVFNLPTNHLFSLLHISMLTPFFPLFIVVPPQPPNPISIKIFIILAFFFFQGFAPLLSILSIFGWFQPILHLLIRTIIHGRTHVNPSLIFVSGLLGYNRRILLLHVKVFAEYWSWIELGKKELISLFTMYFFVVLYSFGYSLVLKRITSCYHFW